MIVIIFIIQHHSLHHILHCTIIPYTSSSLLIVTVLSSIVPYFSWYYSLLIYSFLFVSFSFFVLIIVFLYYCCLLNFFLLLHVVGSLIQRYSDILLSCLHFQYGYRLPDTDEDILYCQVCFLPSGGGKYFTYPLINDIYLGSIKHEILKKKANEKIKTDKDCHYSCAILLETWTHLYYYLAMLSRKLR